MPEPIQHLTGIDLLKVHGPDATAFLQSLLSNDLRELTAAGNAQWTALLTPQGRVIALMALIRTGDQEFLLAVPNHRGDELRLNLQRFVLRRKLELGDAPSSALIGTIASDSAAPGAALPLPFRSGRRWLLASASEAEHYPPAGDDWRRMDLEDGLAFLDVAASGKFLAQAIGLHLLPAVSLGKGCYPGQEIVTRSHYLGKSKRHLALLSSRDGGDAAPPAAGTPLSDAEGRHRGDIVAAVAGPDATTLLASLTDPEIRGKLLLPESAGQRATAELRRLFEQT
ncbi:MAG: folate-binding protein YgfZ [Lysobacterales bacterium]